MRVVIFILASVSISAVTGCTRGPEGFTDPTTALRFDYAVGAYAVVDTTRYADPRLGFSVRYVGPGVEKVDIYLYDLGLPDVPEGAEANEVQQEFKAALVALREMQRLGKYRDFAIVRTDIVQSEFRRGRAPLFLHALVSYMQAPDSAVAYEGPRYSHLYLRGYRGVFLKLRFTYPLADSLAAEGRFRGFLRWLTQQMDPMGT